MLSKFYIDFCLYFSVNNTDLCFDKVSNAINENSPLVTHDQFRPTDYLTSEASTPGLHEGMRESFSNGPPCLANSNSFIVD